MAWFACNTLYRLAPAACLAATFLVGAVTTASATTTPAAAADNCPRLPPNLPALQPEWRSLPIAFRDPDTGIVFYAETDGRHLAAFDPNGKLLWVRNPFEDSKACPYRTARPKISRVLSLPTGYRTQTENHWRRKGPFMEIEFNSSQFGAVDLANGDFLELGQN